MGLVGYEESWAHFDLYTSRIWRSMPKFGTFAWQCWVGFIAAILILRSKLGQAVTPLSYFREITDSNLCRDTNTGEVFRGIPLSVHLNILITPQIRRRSQSSTSLPIHHSQTVRPVILLRLIGATESVVNPLNAELNPICHSLILLGDLTFMGTCIVSIFQYTFNKMQRYTVHLYLETAVHVSGGTSTHHQERIQLYLQHLVFVTPLLLSAAIVEELEPVWVCCGWRTFFPRCVYVFCIYLRTNSDLCHLHHKLIGFYNREEKCLQRGMD